MIKVTVEILKKVRLRWFGHVICEGDTDWIKCCTTMEMELDWTEGADHLRRHGGMVLEIWTVPRGYTGLEHMDKEDQG